MLTYRLANPAPAIWNVAKTIAAIALFDAIFVWALPALILMVQHGDTGLDIFFPPQVEAGEVVFIVSTVLVVWAGLMLAVTGEGTPLPFDAPRRLVIGGPYAWLRSPMVTGTLGQIVAVGLISGSVIVILLFPVVALLWNTFLRPGEEDTLQHLFGRSFELYRRSVRCWLPMRSPWKPPIDYVPLSVSDMPEPPPQQRRKRAE